MLTFNNGLRIYLATEPCDMRKSFNGLSIEVRNKLALDPLSGAVLTETTFSPSFKTHLSSKIRCYILERSLNY